jgi:LPXTG-motif cell wall-anchored protein
VPWTFCAKVRFACPRSHMQSLLFLGIGRVPMNRSMRLLGFIASLAAVTATAAGLASCSSPTSPGSAPSVTTTASPVVTTTPAATVEPTTTPPPASPFVPQLKVTFRDTCTGVTTTVKNEGSVQDTVSLARRQTGIDPFDGVPGQQRIVLDPGESHTATVTPVQGRGFSINWQSANVLGAPETLHKWRKPANCDGTLPITGIEVWQIVIAGLVFLGIGGALLWVARRRRTVTPV